MHFKISSAIDFYLEQSKIVPSGNELRVKEIASHENQLLLVVW